MKKQLISFVLIVACLSAVSLTQTNKSAAAVFKSGKEKAENKDYYGAVDDVTMAIELRSDYAKAYYSRGLAYLKFNRRSKEYSDVIKAKARADFMKAMELGFHVDQKYLDECD